MISLFLGFLILFEPVFFSKNFFIEQKDINTANVLTPKGIRLTASDSPNHSIIISWYTESEAPEPKVLYSESPSLVDNSTVFASVNIIDGTYIYNVNLFNLESSTTYFYQIYSDSSNFREILNFTTAPNRSVTNLRFMVFGDTRTQREPRREIVKKVMENFEDIDFFIHTGDIVEDGRNQTQWNYYFDDNELLNNKALGYYIEGNHERLDGNMYDNILLPSNGINSYYYSFNIGPVNFMGLNTERDRTAQTNWLETELVKADQDNDTLWKFVYMHQPIFNSRSNRPDLTDLISTWCPLFEQYGIDLVYAGHNHYYERSYPMNRFKDFDNSTSYNFENPSNPMYLITGGGGAPLYIRDTQPAYAPFYNSTYHFVVIEINVDDIREETTLVLETWAMPDDYNNIYLIDNMTIVKKGGASVKIHSPVNNQIYGEISPNFNVTIEQFKLKPDWFTLNTTWYSVNGGLINYTYIGSIGKINQTAWDELKDGVAVIKFYANDSIRNLYFNEVFIRKDSTPPNITLIWPKAGEIFGVTAPNFTITIKELNLDKMWYVINVSSKKFFFNTNSSINQDLWDNLPNGIYTITFYVNDSASNEAIKQVLIKKHVSENYKPSYDPSLIFILIFSSNFIFILLLTLYLYRKRKRHKIR
ncbi:MAG: purple acid phosphatase family protein [Candidatus Hodarchaeota archaeon]